MTRPRKEQISIEDTPYYHIVSRCVRRTFLCGTDASTGKSYEHRRSWIEKRLRLLSSIFGIDVCAYAVMSNHIHIAIKLMPSQIAPLSHREIAQRWTCLFKGSLLFQKWHNGDQLDSAELNAVSEEVERYRLRLNDLGWFMKCLNEPIARQANKEDGCTGHFWESRYKSQALLTDEALLSCLAYVDLNPIRACMADRPETSDHTSIKERIAPNFKLAEAIKEQIALESLLKFDVPLKPLAIFEGNATSGEQSGILFSFEDYLQLVDYTGRCVRKDKRGAISAALPSILQRLNIDRESWLNNATCFEKNYLTKFARRRKPARKSA